MADTATYRNALPLGTTLAEYRLESVLGAGGFGMTYLARDANLDKLVAIKEYLPADLALRALDGSIVPVNTEAEHDYQWGLERFIQEARTLARFSHPNIVRVNRYFEANGTGYMVMDYEEGESLSQYLRREPRPDEAALKALLAPLLGGLKAVHGIGFLHRDIKPSNIFMRSGGTPVLLDFGSARQASGTRSLTSVLTPGFAPLEQYSGDGHQGPWSDIYAMAAVIYRAIVDGNPPDAVTRLKADTVAQSLDSARGRYSKAFVDAVMWAMTLDEKARPQSVAQWEAAVVDGQAPAAVLAAASAVPPTQPAASAAFHEAPTQPITQRAGAPVEKTQRVSETRTRPETVAAPRKKSRWRWVGIAVVLVIAVAMAGAWNKQRAAKARAQQEAARLETQKLAAERRARAERAAALEAERQRLEAERSPAAEAPQVSGSESRERPGRDREARPANLPPEQVQQLRRAVEADFRSADTNADGYLSQDEVARRFPFAARQFGRIDTDRDGRISPREFWELRRAQIERRARQ